MPDGIGICDMFDGKVARMKKTGQKMKSGSAYKLIRFVTLSVLVYSPQSSAILWGYVPYLARPILYFLF